MLIIAYDISDDKLRTRFSKFLSKFGVRLQYSLFRVNNSPKVLGNLVTEITCDFEKAFGEKDSVYIFNLSNTCKTLRFGYAKHEESDVIIVE